MIESALNAIEHLKLSCCEVSSSVPHNAKKSLSIPKQHAGRITKFIDGRESRMCEDVVRAVKVKSATRSELNKARRLTVPP